jgi:outer membrane lipoprotein-sorting protein
MKRITVLFIAALFFFSAAVSEASRPDRLDDILANMQRAGGKITTFYADMRQQTVRANVGGRPETYQATVFFKHKGRADQAVIKYSKPAGQTIWVLDNRIVLYQAGLRQVIETTRQAQASKNPEVSFVATPYRSVPQLKSQYNVTYLGDEGAMAKLQLVPKGRSSVSKSILWVDQSMWLPVKYEVTSSNGNVSVFSLSNIGVNGTISDNNFKPGPWPEGTKIVKQ